MTTTIVEPDTAENRSGTEQLWRRPAPSPAPGAGKKTRRNSGNSGVLGNTGLSEFDRDRQIDLRQDLVDLSGLVERAGE